MNVFIPRQRTMRERVAARRGQNQSYVSGASPRLQERWDEAGGLLDGCRGLEIKRRLGGSLRLAAALAAIFLIMAAVGTALTGHLHARAASAPAVLPAVTGTAVPTLEPTIPAVAPEVAARGPVSILVLGSDQRADDSGFRTDVVVLVTIDPRDARVSALSFPRDLIVNVPGYGDTRINTIMGLKGFEGLAAGLEQDFGARPQYYFLTNFEGFVGLINSIGGIDVAAEQPLEDACDLPISRGGKCSIEPGTHTMDGATALWYIRSRHSSSDFDRLRRAQEVMLGIFARFMDMKSLARVPELYQQYRADVETNMDAGQILSLMPVAARVLQDSGRIQRYTIPPDMTADWWMWDGAQVLLPDKEAVRELVRKATFNK